MIARLLGLGGALMLSGVSANAASAQPDYPVSAQPFGARCDARVLSDVTLSTDGKAMSSSTYRFGAGDVGKVVTVAGAGASGGPLNTVISEVAGGTARLANAAGTGGVGATVVFGHDDAEAFQAAERVAEAAGGGVMRIPAGTCIISHSLTWGSRVSLVGQGAGVSILKWISPASMDAALIQGLARNAASPYADNVFADFTADGASAVQSSFNVRGKALYIQHMLRPVFHGLELRDFPATCLGVDFLVQGRIYANTVSGCGRLGGPTSLGSSGIGIGVGNDPQESFAVIGNVARDNARYGIFAESQTGAVTHARGLIADNVVSNARARGEGIGDAGMTGAVIVGNQVSGPAQGLVPVAGIAVDSGTYSAGRPGVAGLIANNRIEGFTYGVRLDYPAGAVSDYRVRGNVVGGAYGDCIRLETGQPEAVVAGVAVTDNRLVRCGGATVAVVGPGAFRPLTVRDEAAVAAEGR
jgi:hypothetical protein